MSNNKEKRGRYFNEDWLYQLTESCFTDSAVIKAEIIWTHKTVNGGFSVRYVDDIDNIFSTMFFDSPTELCITKTKTTHEVTHQLVPYFKYILVNSLNKSKNIYILFWWEFKGDNLATYIRHHNVTFKSF